jgi:hypothetical protein
LARAREPDNATASNRGGVRTAKRIFMGFAPELHGFRSGRVPLDAVQG